jgi:hypothetical protein
VVPIDPRSLYQGICYYWQLTVNKCQCVSDWGRDLDDEMDATGMHGMAIGQVGMRWSSLCSVVQLPVVSLRWCFVVVQERQWTEGIA